MIMYRSFAENMGIKWPKDVALRESFVRGGQIRSVTWAELHARRRKWQEEKLSRIYHFEPPKILPCYVWTFFNRQSIPYYGWYCYIVTRYSQDGVNFRGLDEKLAGSIITVVPLGMLPLPENFYQWMEAFAKAFPRAKHPKDRRKAGSLVGWISNGSIFSLQKPTQ